MFDYTGTSCPYCKKKFVSGDDIAVCPECGTPHHKDCYKEHGQCAKTKRHAEGFDWNVFNTAPGVTDASVAAFPCPNCGKLVEGGSQFCNRCGAQFLSGTSNSPYTAAPEYSAKPSQSSVYIEEDGYSRDHGGATFGQHISEKEFDGIPVADWIKYIGRSALYYLTFFQYQDKTGRKSTFTLSAMLFPPLYFLYRKLWLFALLSALVNFALFFPSGIVYLADAGINFGLDVSFWNTVSLYTNLANYFVGFLWGFNAVRLYRRYSARKIHSIKLKSDTEHQYQQLLEKKAGPSLIALATPFFLLALFSVAIRILA